MPDPAPAGRAPLVLPMRETIYARAIEIRQAATRLLVLSANAPWESIEAAGEALHELLQDTLEYIDEERRGRY